MWLHVEVQRIANLPGCMPIRQIEMGDLAFRVDPGVGSACDNGGDRLARI
jgi:hypothetical protein